MVPTLHARHQNRSNRMPLTTSQCGGAERHGLGHPDADGARSQREPGRKTRWNEAIDGFSCFYLYLLLLQRRNTQTLPRSDCGAYTNYVERLVPRRPTTISRRSIPRILVRSFQALHRSL